MFRFNASVKKRLQTRRLQRLRQRRIVDLMIDGENPDEFDRQTESSDEDPPFTGMESTNVPAASPSCSILFNPAQYNTDSFDNACLEQEDSVNTEESPLLFDGSPTSVREAVRTLSACYIDFNLNKYAVVRLLRTIKALLPSPNRLPTTWRSLRKAFGYVSSSRTTFLCTDCLQRCETRSHGQKICGNDRCSRFNRMMQSNQLVEVIHMDVRSQVRAVLTRNQLLLNRTDLYPKTDVCFGDHYRNLGGDSVNRVTLIVHTDGAPLVKLSKQSLWPCFASLVELPPPIRDYQNNIIVLAMWSSRIKPDPNVFLKETIEELTYLVENGTSIFIGDVEFRISVRTQFFVSDLPAKSLFCRTISFNGYSACTECCSTGTPFDDELLTSSGRTIVFSLLTTNINTSKLKRIVF